MTTNIPGLPTLIQAARDIVTAATHENSLESLTIKKVRRQLERKYSLEEGRLDEDSTKTAIKNAINAALSENAEPPITKRRKTSPSHSDEQEDEPPKKTKKHNKKPSAKDKHAALEKSGSDGNVKEKSRKRITTDSEDNKEGLNPKTKTSAEKADVMLPIKSIKRESNHEQEDAAARESGNGESESELSVLIDDSPRAKRRKGKTKDSKKPSQKAKKEKHVDTMTTDEKTIKRLKSLVSTCGVRKSWSKEFSGLSLPAQQIARLREILADLGMKGRYSLEQAKAIRNKRELARELDDVVEFERKAGTSRSDGGRRQTNAKRAVAELDTNSEISESETDIKDNSKVSTASKSIMAYLANQSSEEE